MDISTVFNFLLTWFADQLAWFSNPLSASIGLMAIVPLLIAMMLRDRTATLVTALFALGAIWLCATQEIDWTLLAIFEATAAFFLAFAAIIRQRRSRALRDEELHALKWRISVIEACERRRFMKSVNDAPQNPLDTTGLLTPAEDAPIPKSGLPLPRNERRCRWRRVSQALKDDWDRPRLPLEGKRSPGYCLSP
jgi:hypothetical protein